MECVFPTPVGVFLWPPLLSASNLRLPHARGGVSVIRRRRRIVAVSSPRPWGCFRGADLRPAEGRVFPTPVGVKWFGVSMRTKKAAPRNWGRPLRFVVFGRRGISVFWRCCLRGRASAFPRRVILLNKARLGKGGGLGEGNTFARQRKGFPSPSSPAIASKPAFAAPSRGRQS